MESVPLESLSTGGKTLGAGRSEIAEQIEWLEKQLDDLLQGKELTSQSESAPKAVPR